MSFECDLARKILKVRRLRTEMQGINDEIREESAGMEKSFAVEIDGYAVTVKPPPIPQRYSWAGERSSGKKPLPLVTVVPLVEHCPFEAPPPHKSDCATFDSTFGMPTPECTCND